MAMTIQAVRKWCDKNGRKPTAKGFLFIISKNLVLTGKTKAGLAAMLPAAADPVINR